MLCSQCFTSYNKRPRYTNTKSPVLWCFSSLRSILNANVDLPATHPHLLSGGSDHVLREGSFTSPDIPSCTTRCWDGIGSSRCQKESGSREGRRVKGGAGCYPAPWHQKVKHISASFGLHVTTRLMDNGQHKEAHAKDQPSMGRRTNPRKRQAWSWGTAQHSTARQSTAQHSTVRHSTASSRHSGRAVPDAERQFPTALLPERRPGAPPGAAHPLCQRLQRSLTPWAQSSAKHPGMKGKKK